MLESEQKAPQPLQNNRTYFICCVAMMGPAFELPWVPWCFCWREGLSQFSNCPSRAPSHRPNRKSRDLTWRGSSSTSSERHKEMSEGALPPPAAPPAPLIRCLLPPYSEQHVWWFIRQYLKSAGFAHTASAFSLELKGCRGVQEDCLESITEVWDVILFLRPSGPRQALK